MFWLPSLSDTKRIRSFEPEPHAVSISVSSVIRIAARDKRNLIDPRLWYVERPLSIIIIVDSFVLAVGFLMESTSLIYETGLRYEALDTKLIFETRHHFFCE